MKVSWHRLNNKFHPRAWHGFKSTFECFPCQNSSAKKCFTRIATDYTIVESSCFYGFIKKSMYISFSIGVVIPGVIAFTFEINTIVYESAQRFKLPIRLFFSMILFFYRNRPGSSQTEHFSPWNIFFDGPFFWPRFFSPKFIFFKSGHIRPSHSLTMYRLDILSDISVIDIVYLVLHLMIYWDKLN